MGMGEEVSPMRAFEIDGYKVCSTASFADHDAFIHEAVRPDVGARADLAEPAITAVG